jgi:hypothetical protein
MNSKQRFSFSFSGMRNEWIRKDPGKNNKSTFTDLHSYFLKKAFSKPRWTLSAIVSLKLDPWTPLIFNSIFRNRPFFRGQQCSRNQCHQQKYMYERSQIEMGSRCNLYNLKTLERESDLFWCLEKFKIQLNFLVVEYGRYPIEFRFSNFRVVETSSWPQNTKN